MVLENELTFTGQVNRKYDDQFAVTGGKIGSTVNVRRPARFIGTTGPNLNVEDFYESSVPVTLTTQFHVDTQFTTQDLALTMDMFSDRVLKPCIATIANKIDRDGLVMAKNATANTVGVPGTAPTGLVTYLTAGAYLDSEGAPRDGKRAIVIDPFTQVAIVDSLKGLFVPDPTISKQFKTGRMGRDSGGMNWYMDQNVVSQTYGAWTTTASTLTANTLTQAGFLQTGWASSSTITLTAGAALTLNQGDTIQIAGLFGANPQNRQSYGKLRSFVINQPVTGTGAVVVNVSPAIIVGGQFQNTIQVGATSATATVTPLSIGTGAVGVVSPQNIMFHQNAYTMACADLLLPEGVHFAGRAADPDVGLSIRVVRQYTINNDAIPTRLDVLYGWAPLYQELGTRVAA